MHSSRRPTDLLKTNFAFSFLLTLFFAVHIENHFRMARLSDAVSGVIVSNHLYSH
jgi:hypothetical protein